ncbi:MAG TPA: GNAT family N-acetyltransferase [Fimbriimonadaceae bacterium]|nr:GNAT family N-acetyltransferase [Fimbriimonadaceae bacterium]
MLVSFRNANFDVLTGLWNECYPEKFRIDAEMLRQNTVESPLFDWGASCIHLDDDAKPVAFTAVKRSANPQLFSGPDRDQGHIAAHVCAIPKVGVDLIAHVKRVLRDRGSYKLAFGADSRHFFPGCPSDCKPLRDFLIIEGFEEGGEAVDVEADLANWTPREGVPLLLPSSAPAGNYRVRPINQSETAALKTFLNREFPGRWSHDVMDKVATEGRPDFVYGLFERDEIVGFALTQDSGHRLPIAGAVFHLGLGEKWGSLGPIGLAKSVRGKGLGDALLASTLSDLKNRGIRQCVIDWTGLIDWYAKHGFTIRNRYTAFSLRLDNPGPAQRFRENS